MPKKRKPKPKPQATMVASDATPLPPVVGDSAGTGSVKRAAFLAAYAQLGNITAASAAAKCSPSNHRNVWMKQADYPELFSEAKEQAIEVLEAEALRRATVGSAEPVFHAGRQVGMVYKKSDVLLIFLLKAARPERYRERMSHELAGPNGGPIVTTQVITDEMREAADRVLSNPEYAKAAALLAQGIAKQTPQESQEPA